MKKVITILCFISVFFGFSQTADELVQQASEIQAQYPKDSRIKNLLNEALEVNPDHEAALYQLAQYHIAGNTDIHALPLLDRAIAINPTRAQYYWLRAKVNIRENAKNTELEQAKEDLANALKFGYPDTQRIANAQRYADKFMQD